MSVEMVVIVMPGQSPEQIARNTKIEDSVGDTVLPLNTLKDSVSPQKVEALRCRVELAAAKQELQTYLREGESNWGHKNGEVRFVEAERMRELTLKAGYTEFALGVMDRMGATDINVSDHYPDPDSDRMSINVRTANRYGLRPGNYDAIEAVDWLIKNREPDYPNGRDPLRRRVLKEIEEVNEIRKTLDKKGRFVSSLSLWDLSKSGKTYFLLNPGYAVEAENGWYTVQQLRGWVNGNPRSTVLKENQKDKPIKVQKRPYWKTRYAEHLGRLSKRTDTEGQRLMRMALMDCPFEDLVRRYYRQTI